MADDGDVLRIDSANGIESLHPWFDVVAQNLPDPPRHAMRVALEEAVMNAATHGFPPDMAIEITVRLKIAAHSAVLCVEDSGRAFDPTVVPARKRPATLLDAEPGVLGLVLLRHYCHNITYQRVMEHNRLCMRFPIPAA